MIHKDEDWLNEQLHQKGINNAMDVYLAEYIRGRLRIVNYPK